MLLGPVVVDREGISPCGHTFSFGRRGVGECLVLIDKPPTTPSEHTQFFRLCRSPRTQYTISWLDKTTLSVEVGEGTRRWIMKTASGWAIKFNVCGTRDREHCDIWHTYFSEQQCWRTNQVRRPKYYIIAELIYSKQCDFFLTNRLFFNNCGRRKS